METLLEVYQQSALVIWLYMTAFYVVATIAKNGGLVDTGWGLGFVVVSTYFMQTNEDASMLQMLMHILVTLWGLRLAIHVFSRTVGKPEDWRYANWRKDWGKTYPWRSYLQIFMLQGFLMSLIALPILSSYLEPGANDLSVYAYIGAALWAVGFFFEAVGDFQLRQFIKNRKTKGSIMKYGVWKYTRHPNYFGEVVQWWGLLIAIIGAPYWQFALISPIAITYLLLKVSGIPMLEKKWDKVEEYQEYKKVTSPFFPMPPKKK